MLLLCVCVCVFAGDAGGDDGDREGSVRSQQAFPKRQGYAGR